MYVYVCMYGVNVHVEVQNTHPHTHRHTHTHTHTQTHIYHYTWHTWHRGTHAPPPQHTYTHHHDVSVNMRVCMCVLKRGVSLQSCMILTLSPSLGHNNMTNTSTHAGFDSQECRLCKLELCILSLELQSAQHHAWTIKCQLTSFPGSPLPPDNPGVPGSPGSPGRP